MAVALRSVRNEGGGTFDYAVGLAGGDFHASHAVAVKETTQASHDARVRTQEKQAHDSRYSIVRIWVLSLVV